jgi:plasmid stabilization system protein ParE
MAALAERTAEATATALSRALYRRLLEPLPGQGSPRARQRVLDACETTVRRLVDEPNFARPARFLFEEIRLEYPIGEQLWLRRVIEVHVNFAKDIIRQLPETARECGASTRAGDPCRRGALPGSEFCPSHRHLERMDEAVEGT